jgi:tRNA dimethylallyltransferase
MNTVVAIIGPSGTGKTALAEQLALHFDGEIISSDSKQVYRGMDIGTAKEKQLKVPQHLIDIKNPGEKMTVAEYQALAYQAIDSCITRGKLPFLVGCSMLYAESVMNGYIFTPDGKSTEQSPRYAVLKLGILVERDELKKRLTARTDQWVEEGLLTEIRTLLDQGVPHTFLDHCGQEYRYFTAHLLGEIDLTTAKQLTNTSLNQYAKRQYTWWRRHDDIQWIASVDEAQSSIDVFRRSHKVV